MAERLERERDAWMESSAQQTRNAVFYRGLLTLIGNMLGDEAKIADDGTLTHDVLVLKVPELVEKLIKARQGEIKT